MSLVNALYCVCISYRGSLYRQLGNFNRAQEDFHLAIHKCGLSPDHPTFKLAIRQLALTYNDVAVSLFRSETAKAAGAACSVCVCTCVRVCVCEASSPPALNLSLILVVPAERQGSAMLHSFSATPLTWKRAIKCCMPTEEVGCGSQLVLLV